MLLVKQNGPRGSLADVHVYRYEVLKSHSQNSDLMFGGALADQLGGYYGSHFLWGLVF